MSNVLQLPVYDKHRPNEVSEMLIFRDKLGTVSIDVEQTAVALRMLRERLNLSQRLFGMNNEVILGLEGCGSEASYAAAVCAMERGSRWLHSSRIDKLCQKLLGIPGSQVFPLLFDNSLDKRLELSRLRRKFEDEQVRFLRDKIAKRDAAAPKIEELRAAKQAVWEQYNEELKKQQEFFNQLKANLHSKAAARAEELQQEIAALEASFAL